MIDKNKFYTKPSQTIRYNYLYVFIRVTIISQKINEETPKSTPIDTIAVENMQLKVATFNLFNYLEPPDAYYDFERIYSAEQWQKKQTWITAYIQEHKPDIIGFQEVFSIESLKKLLLAEGYCYFSVVDQPQVIDDFIYKSPVVAIASRFPIVETHAVIPDVNLAKALGLADNFSFSRKVVRATVDAPHIGHCDCYVVHFKSKRSMLDIETNELKRTPEKTIIDTLKAQVAGSWGSTIQRGSEATLLMMSMIGRREVTNNPMILMGDFNNTLNDGILSHLLTNSLRFVSVIDQNAYLAKYCLHDSWDLFETALKNENSYSIDNKEVKSNKLVTRNPTHYFGASSSVLDYILLSCEFDASYHDSLYEVSDYNTYDRHLINPSFDRDDQSTDHGVVLVTLTLRS